MLQITKAAYGGDPQHLTAYVFDAAGRWGTQTNDVRPVSYQHNEAGGRTRTTWPHGYYVAYGFGVLSRMSSATTTWTCSRRR